jgi:hypothetical protein
MQNAFWMAKLESLRLRRREEDGLVAAELNLTGIAEPPVLLAFGPKVVALVDARKAGGGAPSLPFRRIDLEVNWPDQVVEVYGRLGDPPHVTAVGCVVRSVRLSKGEESTTEPILQASALLPPVDGKDLMWLISKIGADLGIRVQPQQLPLGATAAAPKPAPAPAPKPQSQSAQASTRPNQALAAVKAKAHAAPIPKAGTGKKRTKVEAKG